MPGLQLRLSDDLRQPPMQRTPLSRARIGVDTPGQQRMVEMKAIARDRDNSLVLNVFQ